MTEETAEPTKEPKLTIGQVVLDAMLDGLNNEEALAKVLEEFPLAKTSLSSINWYRNQFRRDHHDIPTARELRAADKKRREAESEAEAETAAEEQGNALDD